MAKISSLSSLSKKPQKLGLGRDLEAPPSQGGTHLQAPGACCVGRTLIRQRGNQSHHDGAAGKFFFSSEFQSAFLCRGPGSASGVTQSEPRLPSTPASRLKHTRHPHGSRQGSPVLQTLLHPAWLHPAWLHPSRTTTKTLPPGQTGNVRGGPTAGVAITPLTPPSGGLRAVQPADRACGCVQKCISLGRKPRDS